MIDRRKAVARRIQKTLKPTLVPGGWVSVPE